MLCTDSTDGRAIEGKSLTCKEKEWKDEWTSNDDLRLEDLKNGKLSTLQESGIYGQALATQNSFLTKKYLTMSTDRHKEVSLQIYREMSEEKRQFEDNR